MVLTATIPIGSLIVGAISHYIGVEKTVLIEGFLALIIAVFYGRYLKNEKLKNEGQSLLEQQPQEE